MQSTLKITSLVAVLGLCLAALAGSAYAYTATYVDTIDAQPIEDVYLVVSSPTITVGPTDVDMEYNTINDYVSPYSGITNDKLFYKLDKAVVTGGDYVKATANGKVARLCVLVDVVKITAFGDNAAMSQFKAVATVNGDATHGATAFLYISDVALNAETDLSTLKVRTTIDYTSPESISTGEDNAKAMYTYLVIDVDQLSDVACLYTDYTDYYNGSTVGDVLIPGFEIAYTATAAQAPVTPAEAP